MPEPRMTGYFGRGRQLLIGKFLFSGHLIEAPGMSIWDTSARVDTARYLAHGFDWLDDLVLFPIGEVLDYKPGFGMTFNAYNFLEIKKGQIVNATTISLEFYKKNFQKCHAFLSKKDLIALKEKLAN